MTAGTAVRCSQQRIAHPGDPIPTDSRLLYVDVLAPLGIDGVNTYGCTRGATTVCPQCRRNVCTPCSVQHGVCCIEEVIAA